MQYSRYPQSQSISSSTTSSPLLSYISSRTSSLAPQQVNNHHLLTSTSDTSSSSHSSDRLDSRLANMKLRTSSSGDLHPTPPPSRRAGMKGVSPAARVNPRIKHYHRPHIFEKVHKARVKQDRIQLQNEIRARELQRKIERQARLNRDSEGYSIYKAALNVLMPYESKTDEDLIATNHGILDRPLRIGRITMKEPKTHDFKLSALEQLQRLWREKDAKIEERLHPKAPPLPTSLLPEEESRVKALLNKRGTVAKYAKETVTDADLSRLRPGQWLNDEIINFYGAMILGRAEGGKENVGVGATVNGKDGVVQRQRQQQQQQQQQQRINGRGRPLSVHYFSTFFWSKLVNEGYEKGRLAKWTKKVDIFSKDVVLIPVNHSNAHWTAAAINFRRKRIESYDSMGMAKDNVFRHLRAYVDAEHRNKRKTPFDFSGWQDYAPDDITPQQANGYDCGVFTCQYLECLSRGEEMFRFTQKDMAYLRRRMVWEIGHGTLRED